VKSYRRLKDGLTRVGSMLPDSVIRGLDATFNYVYVGWWMRRNAGEIPARFDRREELYGFLKPQIQEPATFLEFGVFRGDSLRFWAGMLRHPQTSFAGFDSFEGLPEDWGFMAKKGTFDVKGQIPKIDDPRVKCIKGWFSDTLPGFLKSFVQAPTLIIHLDADLYSSTIYILQQLQPFIRDGTFLIFDELCDRDHELRALDEFCKTTGMVCQCVGSERTLTSVALRVKSRPAIS
jgi:O-methyltransferase